jgi:hypothetical protein
MTAIDDRDVWSCMVIIVRRTWRLRYDIHKKGCFPATMFFKCTYSAILHIYVQLLHVTVQFVYGKSGFVQYRRPNGWTDRAQNLHKHSLELCDEGRRRAGVRMRTGTRTRPSDTHRYTHRPSDTHRYTHRPSDTHAQVHAPDHQTRTH